ncbi:hypothetical protein DIURU_002894 [Diutina rugosa]|uniref:MPN domain-containing protein n=1 Tax=Diutina rugosa TaxID=5481 RepID=A0A642UNU8_DIURU|nr:uncharacterized protein DIURU_002894 [Diutina rugosa]KAA8902440.1 hypothetical protein DIURU_002894 [Diutina rugosa]
MFMHLVRPNVAAPAASSASGPAKIKIHTPALLQILEIIAKQVLPEHKRAIGTLLGIRSDDGSEFEIREAFMVPCNDTGDTVVIDDQAHKAMYQLYKKAHPKEAVLGWFGSAKEIDDTTGLIHDFYSKPDRAHPFPAIYLNVDFLDAEGKPKHPEIVTYIGAAVGKPQQGWKQANYIFSPIPNEVVHATATEQIAYSQVARGKTLEQDLEYLDQQLGDVSDNIDTMLAAIEQLEQKDDDASLEVLRLMSNNLLTRPKVDAGDKDALSRMFRNHNQDVVMIECLTKAVKEQIELSAKLTQSSELEKRA